MAVRQTNRYTDLNACPPKKESKKLILKKNGPNYVQHNPVHTETQRNFTAFSNQEQTFVCAETTLKSEVMDTKS